MSDVIKKFIPFKSQEENNVMPQLAFDGKAFPYQEKDNHCTLVEDPNDTDSFVVVNRGRKKDCEMIEDAINNIIQECLHQFLIDNADDILDMLHGFRQAERESRLKELGYEISEEKILDIRSGRSLI